MPGKLTSLLFALIFALSFALLTWWAVFALVTTDEMIVAAEELAAGDIDGAVQALGAGSVTELAHLARSRRWMFITEGAFFAVVLVVAGWLYLVAVRREGAARQAQDRFLAAATHELKTPLATLVLLLDSLRSERVPPAKLGRYLANGLREAERLRLGLDNVLTAAGMRTAKHAGKLHTGDLVADVREAMAAVAGHALVCSVQLQTQLPAHLSLRRDPVAMQLVLRNLLDNAIKYSHEGGNVQLTLQEEAGTAILTIVDDGRGMDAEELQHAFLPFWRGSDAASGGTGLGLHLAHELVRAHGGSIGASSRGRDLGTKIVVSLPLRGGAA